MITTAGGLSISQAARYLGIGQTVLGRWRKEFTEEIKSSLFRERVRVRPHDEESFRLRRELAIVR